MFDEILLCSIAHQLLQAEGVASHACLLDVVGGSAFWKSCCRVRFPLTPRSRAVACGRATRLWDSLLARMT